MEMIELKIMKFLNENVRAVQTLGPGLYERIEKRILQRTESLETQIV